MWPALSPWGYEWKLCCMVSNVASFVTLRLWVKALLHGFKCGQLCHLRLWVKALLHGYKWVCQHWSSYWNHIYKTTVLTCHSSEAHKTKSPIFDQVDTFIWLVIFFTPSYFLQCVCGWVYARQKLGQTGSVGRICVDGWLALFPSLRWP